MTKVPKQKSKGVRVGNKTRRRQGPPPSRGGQQVGRPASNFRFLDRAAQEYLALLGDPCGSPMVPAVYPGVCGTQYLRVRVNLNPGASAVDGLLYFTPSLLSYCGTATASGPLQFYSVNSSGAGPSNLYSATVPPLQGSTTYDRARCLAACLKLRYTGSELNRAGQVATNISESSPLGLGTVAGYPTTTTPSVVNATQVFPSLRRLGEVAHEVRWLPAENDAFWFDVGSSFDGGLQSAGVEGNSIAMGFFGVPPGSCYWEATLVFEVMPSVIVAGGTAGSLVQVMRAPPSRNTLNQVLQAIDNVTDWATGMGGQKLLQVGRGVYNLASAVAPAMMSLM
jgi:hypothetical protein